MLLDANYYVGGQTTKGGVTSDNSQENWQFSASLSRSPSTGEDGKHWYGSPMNDHVCSGRNDKSGDHEVTDVIEDGLQTGLLERDSLEGFPRAG